MKLKRKLPYNIRKFLFKVLSMVLLMGAPAMNSCTPEDGPTPSPNIPQITGIVTWNWNENLENAPKKEDVEAFANSEYVSEVHILLSPKEVPFFTGSTFHSARDTLQNLINVNPTKVKGSGEIRVNPVNAASLPFPDSTRYGMAKEDSLWFVQNGWRVFRMPNTK